MVSIVYFHFLKKVLIKVTIYIKCIIQKLARLDASRSDIYSNNVIVNFSHSQKSSWITGMSTKYYGTQRYQPVPASRWSHGALLLSDGSGLCSFEQLPLLTPYQRLNWKKNTILRSGNRDFPGSPVAKTLRFQCKGPRFDPWLGNWIPHATAKSLHAATKTWHSQINNLKFLKDQGNGF